MAAQGAAEVVERQRVEDVGFVAHARRAVSTPQRVVASAARECASLEITSLTPRSRARRALTSERSRR